MKLMKYSPVVALASILASLLISTAAFAASAYPSGSVGTDISWPQCGQRLSGLGSFGVVGVTDGMGYSTSPCIAAEASHYTNVSLYVNAGWYSASSHVNANSPRVCDPTDEDCLAYNYGYNAGLYAVNAAQTAGVAVNTNWWLDVETGNTWSSDTVQNQNSLQGEYDALVASGATNVGAYSTTVQWDQLTGSWNNGWSGWGATTVKTASQAKTYCTGHQFTGGPTLLIQFSGKVDQDYAC